MNSYHNTNGLSGAALQDAVSKAVNQDDAVLLIYKETRKKWTPSQIHAAMEKAGHKILITSVRRAISNLTKKKDLLSLHESRPGPYGRPEGLWQINPLKWPAPTGYKQGSIFN